MPRILRSLSFLTALVSLNPAFAQEDAEHRWLARQKVLQAEASPDGVRTGVVGDLPLFTVTPAKTGQQLVRVSIAFPPLALPKDLAIMVSDGATTVEPDMRILTWHSGTPPSVRRAIVTFPFTFPNLSARKFTLSLFKGTPPPQVSIFSEGDDWQIDIAGHTFSITDQGIVWKRPDQTAVIAEVIAPPRSSTSRGTLGLIESGRHYKWVRASFYDEHWPRVIELRADSLGTVVLQARLQRLDKGDATAPDLGWKISGAPLPAVEKHVFTAAESSAFRANSPQFDVSFPDAHLLQRGYVSSDPADASRLVYLRCTSNEKVPMQETAWRSAAIAFSTSDAAALSPLLEPSHRVIHGPHEPSIPSNLTLYPDIDDLIHYNHAAIARAALHGDDYGNVTSFNPGGPASYYGMNRLNHCPPIFEEHARSGDAQLRETAVQWCSNMYDLSLWWGDTPDYGGTRYNAAVAAGEKEHEGDTSFLWRTNWTSHFCTKGFDSFFYAYEETGDPRFLTALHAQVAYAKQYVHTNTGECRNIGDVADFVRLYRATGAPVFREEALRLFRELTAKLGDDSLFSQGGQPIVKDGPFIDDDKHGYDAPFAKPYIIGYALAGLPDLLEIAPDEPRLRDVVRAVADFLAASVDPAGGWRYPHPRSSGIIISQGMEHAAQLTNAARVLEHRGEDISNLLDAIETVLQARVLCYQRSGQILAGLSGWEQAAGLFKDGKTIYDLYKKPEDRDRSRDYTEGAVGLGGAPPDGLVYLDEVLAFYLAHRPAERLFNANAQLAQVLARVPDARLMLTPQEAGSFVHVVHPNDPSIGFTIWGPEWCSFPLLGYSREELGGMNLDWKRDEATGAIAYTVDRPDATFTAQFIPRLDHVECLYTTWPKPEATVSGALTVGPCQQMKGGVFDGDDADLMSRMYFLSDGVWTSLASCANGNARNIQFVKGGPSADVEGEMAASGWKTIHHPRPDIPLLACVSTDGHWIAATAAENGTAVCNNANESHRCMHSHGAVPLRRDGPTTLRVKAYLLRGTLDDVRTRYERDRERWAQLPGTPGALSQQTATYGTRDLLPAFNDARVARMSFNSAWDNSSLPFADWRKHARETYLASLGSRPPLAPFAVSELAQEDRGSYVAHKLAFNISADERTKAYLLVPKDEGPHPALIALHDHGAHFSIGKEKVVRPFAEPGERVADAAEWTDKYYGARWIGDTLADRGYVVFATDALFWGDRGRFGGVNYEDQQALGANMLMLGLSWAGKITWDDVRSAEFVQGLPYVDPDRIGCLGLSMGSHRTWSLCAATDIVKCGAAICWMGDTPTLTAPGNNQTKGQSAFSMLIPGLRNELDYPDVASIACPKPMLFYNGAEDGLFPVPGVEASYAKMRAVWEAQGAGDRLVTKLWPVPHEFNAAMQDEAFAWLDTVLK
ncbi:MAG: dienelactone hydrolase family protein [Candidatus Hydrogenedentes bacterium]|nr:dienelactone hydrolase family protein [Candidatus Hydrogenedentota bacterium]